MERKTFFYVLERKLDLQKEYEKMEYLVLNSGTDFVNSLNNCIDFYFKDWKEKENFFVFL